MSNNGDTVHRSVGSTQAFRRLFRLGRAGKRWCRADGQFRFGHRFIGPGCDMQREWTMRTAAIWSGTALLLVAAGAQGDKGATRRKEAIQPLFGLTNPSDGPFPSDRFTVADKTQNTCERINLPMPSTTTEPSAQMEVKLLNELDGFNTRPRIAIPFNGEIDLSTVNSDNIF